jgi:hypothetical protein
MTRLYFLTALALSGTAIADDDVIFTISGEAVSGLALSIVPLDGGVKSLGGLDTDSDGLCDRLGGTDSDGLCDAGDADDDCERLAGGGKGDIDSDGLCDALAADGGFVFGTTVYMEVRTADGDDTFSSTASGSIFKQTISADIGSKSCAVGVFDGEGLVLSAEVACAEVGGVADEDGGAAPRDLDITLVYSEATGTMLPQVTWAWIDAADAADLIVEGWMD